MDFQHVMAELEAAGTEQNRKTYRRHGAPEPLFGVSFAKLEELRKRIKRDHALAEALWATENTDARTLALMIADPEAFTSEKLETWATEVRYHGLACYLVPLTAASAHAREKLEQWLDHHAEMQASLAWRLIKHFAMNDADAPDEAFARWIPRIERDIHGERNRVKEAMNLALIGIGMRSEALEAEAIAAARRIGKVHVDHGDTSCKTPDAEPYILKGRAHLKAKAEKAAAKRRTPAARTKASR